MRHQKTVLNYVKSTFVLFSLVTTMALTAVGVRAVESVTVVPQETVTDQTAKPAPMSLVQVLAYALDHNPQRQAAWYAAKAAKARIGTAASEGGLQVNLNGSASNQWGFGSVGTYVPGGGLPMKGWRESLAADATLPIYTGGRVKGNKKVAGYNYQQAVAQAVGTEQDLIFNTTLDYLKILQNQQLADVNQANLAVAKERYRIAIARVKVGAAIKQEELRAYTDEATAQQDLVEAQNALKQSYANLNAIMGRAPQTPLVILPVEQLTLPQPLIANPAQLGKSTFTSNALLPGAAENTIAQPQNSATLASGQQLAEIADSSSPSLAALQAQVLAAEASVGVAKAGKKPSLGLNLGALISNPISYLVRFIVSLGGSLVQNLFDSGRTSSQVRTAQATVQQLKSSLQNGELNVANQIENSLLALNSAKEREVSTKTAVPSAQEALRIAQLGYAAGKLTSLNVIDAQAALLTAQTDAINSRFDMAASQAQLAAAVGVLTDEGQEAYGRSVPLEKVIDKKGE
ncbi:MAG: TolC family protein [Abditibacteriaceae bacterium]